MRELLISKKSECKIFYTRPLKKNVFDRQIQIPGFNQEKLASASVVLIGAGGLGGEIGEGLVRKGVGRMKIFDSDVVEPTNLNRQFFFKENLYKNKAISLAQNLARFGFGKTALYGYPYTFEEATALNMDLNCSLAVVGVDNNLCRVHTSSYFLKRKIPVIFTAVSEDGNSGYVFIQESKEGAPCFGCLKQSAVEEVMKGILKYPCPNTPAIKDILKTVAGPVLYAVDTLMMSRKREWNYRVIFLDGSIPSSTAVLERRKACLICEDRKEELPC